LSASLGGKMWLKVNGLCQSVDHHSYSLVALVRPTYVRQRSTQGSLRRLLCDPSAAKSKKKPRCKGQHAPSRIRLLPEQIGFAAISLLTMCGIDNDGLTRRKLTGVVH
jgi:hypothetical protein